MTVKPPRVTAALVAVLNVLLAAREDDPPWGLRLCSETEFGPGTIYPLLDRLSGIGWVESWWEDANPQGGQPRRFYRVTSTGAREFAALRAAREARVGRWRPATH